MEYRINRVEPTDKTDVKVHHGKNCDTYHIIPAFMTMYQFKTAMDAIFGLRTPYCDKWGYYTPSDMSKLRALNQLKHLGVLQRKEHGRYDWLPTERYLSLFCSAKRNGYYYWAGEMPSTIEEAVLS